jgi:hypothetical protein
MSRKMRRARWWHTARSDSDLRQAKMSLKSLWRWCIPILGLLIVAAVVAEVVHYREGSAQEKRERMYRQIVESYSLLFTPGTTREQVEGYLHSRNIPIQHMCCVDFKAHSHDVFDDLVKIGQEKAPWFCSEKNIYVAFQFDRRPLPSSGSEPVEASDRLINVSIFRWLEGCL